MLVLRVEKHHCLQLWAYKLHIHSREHFHLRVMWYAGADWCLHWGENISRNGLLKMVGKYEVITLCGSTRFKDAFMEAQKRLTLKENIVIGVGLIGHSGDDEVWTEGTKEMHDLLKEGCYFSINASMTLSEAGRQRLVNIPSDRLLIESDGPYSKINGSRFSPEKLAALYREVESVLQIENLERVVFQNTYRLLTM